MFVVRFLLSFSLQCKLCVLFDRAGDPRASSRQVGLLGGADSDINFPQVCAGAPLYDILSTPIDANIQRAST